MIIRMYDWRDEYSKSFWTQIQKGFRIQSPVCKSRLLHLNQLPKLLGCDPVTVEDIAEDVLYFDGRKRRFQFLGLMFVGDQYLEICADLGDGSQVSRPGGRLGMRPLPGTARWYPDGSFGISGPHKEAGFWGEFWIHPNAVMSAASKRMRLLIDQTIEEQDSEEFGEGE